MKLIQAIRIRLRQFALILCVACAVSITGCATLATFASSLASDPVGSFNTIVTVIQAAVGASRSAFDIWALANPTAAPAQRATFESYVSQINAAIRLAQEGIGAATAADIPARLAAAKHAVGLLHEFLSGLGTPPGAAASPEMQEALVATARAAR